ncbi:hypothetical protein PSAL_006000 [Pseudooceanicola algae]|uniref:Uncharacterized protein n=2 Tax=Pseudooceanicola algae TaxID=1537215 RepID=A0A418SDN6_9RHOB|nr:hypothetical protein PSAL_006000 [Pseudooceanicola algae]
MRGVTRRLERDFFVRELTAWQTARLVGTAFHAPAKFPSFKEFQTAPAGPARRPDWKAVKGKVLQFVAATGGEVIIK